MILDTVLDGREPEVVRKLDALPQKFYLTGSRYMNCARPDSDWDFITEDTPDTRIALTGLGFGENIRPDDEYGDMDADEHTNAVVVCVDMGVNGGEVQVQLARSAATKRAARDIVYAYLKDEHIKATRSERQHIWRTLCGILEFKAEASKPEVEITLDDFPF